MVTDATSLPALTDLVARHSRALVDRTRRWPASAWRRPAGSLGTTADAVHHLVRVLAELGQLVEAGPAVVRRPERPAYDAALADQLAVVSHDLVAALRERRPGDTAGGTPVERLAALALAETLLHGYACDHRALDEPAAAAAVTRLVDGAAAPYAAALLALGDCLADWAN